MSVRRTLATVIAASALAVASVLAAAPAQAAAPRHYVETQDFTIAEHPYYSEVCGFPVELHVWGSASVVEWTDEEGRVTKEIRNFRFRSITANGVSINGITMGPEIWTFAEDGTSTFQRVGAVNRRVPGAGTGDALRRLRADVHRRRHRGGCCPAPPASAARTLRALLRLTS